MLRRLESSKDGLSESEAGKRREKHGPNELPSQQKRKLWQIFLHQFLSPLIYILIAAGSLSLFLKEWLDAGFIFGVILFNATLGSLMEGRAEKSMEKLREFLKTEARVKRDGSFRIMDATLLAPGDVVSLSRGDRIPADLRLLQTDSLSVDESPLTGESTAASKHSETLGDEDAPLGDRGNMAFAGTTAVSGGGEGVVVATGNETVLGRIAKKIRASKAGRTPLMERIDKFTRHIAIVILVVSALYVGYGMFIGIPFTDVFFVAVALAVAAIPEGLPVAMTVALAIGSRRMAGRNVVVRRLSAVEGLGSCTLIATDKTGTLTRNRQTANMLQGVNGQRFRIGSAEENFRLDTPDGREANEDERGWIDALADIAVLCNDAQAGREPGDTPRDMEDFKGDPMDVALLVMAERLGRTPEAVCERYALLDEIPFESEKRFAARFWKNPDGKAEVFIKGAGDTVANFCKESALPEGIQPLNTDEVLGEVEKLSADGYRVLAFARGTVEDVRASKDALNAGQFRDLTFMGMVGMIDPLRPEAKGAIAECRDAGIRVVMITGDHPATALSIAENLNIAERREQVRTGRDLLKIAREDGSENPEFVRTVYETPVFARVSPIQKLEIVQSLRKKGHYIAVTGDGVNDAPALKNANIGVAMGSGTEVTKDTASIIVTDDNFASIVAGVEEGRHAYANIRKVIYFLIATAIAEIIVITFSLVMGLGLPLLALQLLWLNFVSSGIQDVALAFEGGEEGVMRKPPRNPEENVFNRQMIEETLLAGSVMGLSSFILWWWLLHNGYGEPAARNMVLLFLVLLENYHVFNCRSETRSAFSVPISRNRVLVAGVLGAQGVHILAMYVPFTQQLLSLQPVSLPQWLGLLASAAIILISVEIYKHFRH